MRILSFAVALTCGLVLARDTVGTLTGRRPAADEDHWRYWAAARVVSVGADPFGAARDSGVKLPELEPELQGQQMVLTPPWALALALPLTLLPYGLSRTVWLAAATLLMLGSIVLLALTYGVPRRAIPPIAAVGYLFAPTIFSLRQVQITPWVLFGISAFLFFVEHKRDWLAGAALALASVKPQLCAAIWIAVLVWTMRQRHWKVAGAFAMTIALGSAVVLARDPAVFAQFARVYQDAPPVAWRTPTLGHILRELAGRERFWLQFLPPIVVVAWAAVHSWRQLSHWNWLREMPLLLWASVLGSPYSWTYDEIVLLVPAVACAAAVIDDASPRSASAVLVAFLALSAATVFLHDRWTDEWFFWFAPALLAWSCWARAAPASPRALDVAADRGAARERCDSIRL
jgi:hypothetical protein